ncbi:putative methylesterase 13 [Citrus sinensis]|uniref:Methylesterase 13 n=1 Tax=Citrus sinensis TaxID=2711 RepID=A0ACB8LFZ6_CITSI|nr:putative methylesterase 13 [Citrus sinensis]
MGNAVGCVSAGVKAPKKASSYGFNPFPLFSSFHGRPRNALQSSSSSSRNKKQKRERIQVDEGSAITSEQALPAALPFHSDQTSSSIPFSRSTSVVHPSLGSKKQSFQRSSSARRRSNNDPLIKRPHQLVNQEPKIESPETSHFVLVHGGGFGAWCWYKTMTLLKESGFKVDAVDLTGSGVSSCDTNSITSLEQYVKPLIDTFNELGNEEKVILVGHDFGGACISYVMELFPSKVAKAVFIAATMLTSGQSALDAISQQMGSNDLMQQAQIFLYANGKQNPPTSIDLDRTLLRDLLFNQSAAKVNVHYQLVKRLVASSYLN